MIRWRTDGQTRQMTSATPFQTISLFPASAPTSTRGFFFILLGCSLFCRAKATSGPPIAHLNFEHRPWDWILDGVQFSEVKKEVHMTSLCFTVPPCWSCGLTLYQHCLLPRTSQFTTMTCVDLSMQLSVATTSGWMQLLPRLSSPSWVCAHTGSTWSSRTAIWLARNAGL